MKYNILTRCSDCNVNKVNNVVKEIPSYTKVLHVGCQKCRASVSFDIIDPINGLRYTDMEIWRPHGYTAFIEVIKGQ